MPDHATYPSILGKRIFVTGGATGIGAAIVTAFVEQGASVGFVDLDAEHASTLSNGLGEGGYTEPWFRRIDVTDTSNLQSAIEDFAKSAGGLDVLINNVANDSRHEALSTTPETWRSCMAVNLDSAFFAAQSAIKIMLRSNDGVVLNLSSINALLGPANMPGYVTAKAGMLGMTRALAREFGPQGIRVNSILPGWVVTQRQLDLWLTEAAERDWMEQVCLKNRIEPREVANLALFLSAEDSRMITNQNFLIDGGRV